MTTTHRALADHANEQEAYWRGIGFPDRAELCAQVSEVDEVFDASAPIGTARYTIR